MMPDLLSKAQYAKGPGGMPPKTFCKIDALKLNFRGIL